MTGSDNVHSGHGASGTLNDAIDASSIAHPHGSRLMIDPCRQFLLRSGWFDPQWYLQYMPAARDSDMEPLEHYLKYGACAGVGPNSFIHGLGEDASRGLRGMDSSIDAQPADQAQQLQDEMDLLANSSLFDAAYYLDNNPDVAAYGADPLRHFCELGWRELRRPNRHFDVWWYWSMYLDPAHETINPLVHYALVGQRAGLLGRADGSAPGEGTTYPEDKQVRRICLLAGYDPDGVVDDYVVALVRELSRHADVYYLADCYMQDGELDKLAPYTRDRWARSHGAYDFGSYSMLARDLVGWEEIERYDEMILANDSGYLLGGMDHVFAKMDRRACDWWGLQATKGLARTRSSPANQFAEPIPMDRVKAEFVDIYEDDYLYDFHVGSYFLVYRKPVIADRGFRRLLDAVHEQPSKLRIIQKYEIGFTHYLIGNNYAFDTFIDCLYPFHPLFTRHHFDLIEEGYPFLKRYFLSENHYATPDLIRWKERVLELVPDAPVEMMERNLLRVADHDKLHRSFSITTSETGEVIVPKLLDANEFRLADHSTPTFDHWWAFPVCAFNDTFSGNERAVFEEVRNDPSIKKIVLTRRKAVDIDGENIVVVPLRSPEGQHHLMRSRQIFIKHSPTRNLIYPVSPKWHNLINLWHGIPLKRIGYASLDMRDKLAAIGAEHAKCRAVISSSKIDSMAMASGFYPLSYNKIWCTGLPRNDFVLQREESLPQDLRDEGEHLQYMLQGRRLLLFVPTFKAGQNDAYYKFTAEEVETLHAWLRNNHVVLGVREHMADSARTYNTLLRGSDTIDLSDRHFPNIEVLYRHAAGLVTDYSSCFIDFMLTGRPMVSFAYDYDRYANTERGLFYDMEHVFPGAVCRGFAQLMSALDGMFEPLTDMSRLTYEWKRRLFFDHVDDGNAWRVVKKVKQLYIQSSTEL